MTLSDLERSSDRHYTLFYIVRQTSEPINFVKFTEARQTVAQGTVFGNILFMEDDARYLCGSRASCNNYTVYHY